MAGKVKKMTEIVDDASKRVKKITNDFMTKVMADVIDDATKKMQAIADDYRRNVVLPACSRFKLEYMAGNGGWSFYMNYRSPTRFVTIGSIADIESLTIVDLDPDAVEDEATQKRRDALVRDLHWHLDDVIECLNIEGIGSYDCLGLYIDDIKAKDWK